MPFYNILTGVLLALGLRFAGSQSPVVRDLLVSYLDQFLRLSRLPCPHYDARVTLNSVRNCLDVIALATASVMAGSGDLIVLRRLRSLHGRTDKDTPFGSHMASHMAIGTLFLGGGTMTFGTSDLAVAGLCIAFYPLFPGDVLDNKTHLQALRHLWVLAVEGRCLVARTGESVVG
ncbi:MAG: Anaphase-promoting complex subunit 1, partial [Watsoniomyces obsoletus]